MINRGCSTIFYNFVCTIWIHETFSGYQDTNIFYTQICSNDFLPITKIVIFQIFHVGRPFLVSVIDLRFNAGGDSSKRSRWQLKKMVGDPKEV